MKACWFLAGIVVIQVFAGCSGCTDQHNPRPDWKRFENERVASANGTPQLNDDGTLPAAGGPVFDVAKSYAQNCATCHGVSGKGDGNPALSPVPRNFADQAWQNSVDDERIATAISGGGAAVGISATMPPWGGVLSEDEVKQMVAYIRKFNP